MVRLQPRHEPGSDVVKAAGTGSAVSKVNLQEVIFTPADAAEALETISGLEKDERGSIPARLMYDDPHKPPTWWHVRHMLNLTLLARTAAVQEGTAPAPGNPPQMSFVEDPVNNGAALLRLKAKLTEWKDGTEPIPPAILPTYEGQTWIDIDSLDFRFDRPEPHPDPEFHREARWKMTSSLSNLLETIHPTEETIHGPRCHICYDESDLNIRIAPDYYFAKGVPGPGILATGPVPNMGGGKAAGLRPGNGVPGQGPRGPDHQAETLPGAWNQGILAPGPHRRGPLRSSTGRGRLEGGVYQPILLHRLEKGNVWGHSEATGIDLFWMNETFVFLGPDTEK